ncbi:MAG: ATP-binding protein [Candidatus Anstonellales archaeon]
MYIEREINEKFEKVSKVYNIVAIVGPRQAGKTTFLKEKGKIDASYLSFDDPDVLGMFEDIKKFEHFYLSNKITILDEVQYATNSGIKLKYLADKGKKIWITSSSEVILGKEVLSYLVGRATILRIYPFSWNEFLLSKGKSSENEFPERQIERFLLEHILFGGYPKVVLSDNIEMKKIILKDLYDLMILKDVAKTFSINDLTTLQKFTKFLAHNIGNCLVYETLSNSLNISFETIKKYLDALEKSYLIIQISPFFTNKTKEIIKQPKIYFIDTGMRNVIIDNFETTIQGNLFENYVLSELVKLGITPKYWRSKSKAEVDFILDFNNSLIPIEVKLNEDKIGKSLYSFIEIYKPKYAFIVNYKTIQKTIKIKNCKVFFCNILKLKEKIKEIKN